MYKLSLALKILSFIFLICLVTTSLFEFSSALYFVFLMGSFICLLIDRRLSRKLSVLKTGITHRFVMSGDFETFEKEVIELDKKIINSYKNKILDKISIALASISASDFQKAEEYIIQLSREQSKMDDVSMICYLKLCADYFFYQNKKVELREVVNKMDHILANCKVSIQRQFAYVFVTTEAKSNILDGLKLDDARRIYSTMFVDPKAVINVASRNYILSLIDIKEKKYEDAVKRLKEIVSTDKISFFHTRAKELLEQLNK